MPCIAFLRFYEEGDCKVNVRTISTNVLLISAIFICIPEAAAQETGDIDLSETYTAMHYFTASGCDARVNNLILKRDRAEMTFAGTLYFPKPVHGKVIGAMFIGKAKFHAKPPLCGRSTITRLTMPIKDLIFWIYDLPRNVDVHSHEDQIKYPVVPLRHRVAKL
jgi:hypothetical protein